MPSSSPLDLTTYNYNFNAFRNYSDNVYLEEDPEERSQRFFQVSILFVMSFFGFILNAPIIILLGLKRLRRRKCFRNIDFLILHLSIADLLVAAFCVLTDGVWKLTYQWLAGNAACKLLKFMQMFSLYASTFIIVAISIDRCLVISNPLPRFNQHTVIKFLTLSAWVLAFAFSIPQMVIFRVEKAPFTVDNQELWQCCTHGAYSYPWEETTYVLFTFMVIFAIPLLVIFASYTMIFMRLSRKSLLPKAGNYKRRKSCSDTCNGSKREHTMKRAKKKALLLSVLVITTFVVCWAPYHFSMIYFVISNREMDSASVVNAFHHFFFFGMSNSVINPVIYGAFHFVRKTGDSRGKHTCSLGNFQAIRKRSTTVIRQSSPSGRVLEIRHTVSHMDSHYDLRPGGSFAQI